MTMTMPTESDFTVQPQLDAFMMGLNRRVDPAQVAYELIREAFKHLLRTVPGGVEVAVEGFAKMVESVLTDAEEIEEKLVPAGATIH